MAASKKSQGQSITSKRSHADNIPVITISDSDDDDDDGLGDSGDSCMLPGDRSGRMGFYSGNLEMSVSPPTFLWTEERPFENYSDDDLDEDVFNAATRKQTERSIPRKSQTHRKTPSSFDQRKRKRNVLRIEDSSSSDGEGIILTRKSTKSYRISDSDDDDECSTNSTVNDGVIRTSAIPPDLLEPCSVVLERLPDEDCHQPGIASTTAAADESHAQNIFESNLWTQPLLQRQMPANHAKRPSQKVHKKQKNAVGNPEPIKRSLPVAGTSFMKRSEKSKTTSSETSHAKVRCLSEEVETAHSKPATTFQRQSLGTSHDRMESNAQGSSKNAKDFASRQKILPVSAQIGRCPKSTSEKISYRKTIQIDIANVPTPFFGRRSRISSTSATPTSLATSSEPSVEKRVSSLPVEASNDLNAQHSTVDQGLLGQSNAVSGLDATIQKGRQQLENRSALQRRLISSETPAQTSAQAASSLSAVARIPVLSPSKRTKTIADYVSPLSNLHSEEERAPTKKQVNASDQRRQKRPLSRESQKGNNLDTVKRPLAGLGHPTALKSILKRSVGEEEPSKPKKKVSINVTPQIRFIESRKRAPDEVAPDSAEIGSNVTLPMDHSDVSLNPEDEIVSCLLKWNPEWFRQAMRLRNENDFTLPPIAGNLQILKVEKAYGSMQSYTDSYKTLIIHEMWEHLLNEYQASPFEDRERLSCRVTSIASIGSTFKKFSVIGLIHQDHVHTLRAGVLIMFRLSVSTADNQQRNPVFFGLVVSRDAHRCRRMDEIPPELRKTVVTQESVKHIYLLYMAVKARSKTNLPMCEKVPMIFQVVCDQSPVLRLVKAMTEIATVYQPLILMPRHISGLPTPTIGSLLINSGASIAYNKSQLDTISSCIRTFGTETARLGLICGARGSGKSQTVIGLIEEIQQMKVRSQLRGVVLVATANGESVDELSRRIITLNRYYQSFSGSSQKFVKFLRLGQNSMVADDVSRYSIGLLVDNQIRTEMATAAQKGNNQEIRDRIAHLKGRLHEFTNSQLSDVEAASQAEILREIAELEQTRRQRGGHRTPLTAASLQDRNSAKFMKHVELVRRNMIFHADVVACTLNKDGDDLDLLKKMHRANEISVLCAIVDDADQATELETLILAYQQMTKIFLFGCADRAPPPPALSRVAEQNGVNGSLFTRLLSNFEGSSAPVSYLTGFSP